MFQPVNRYKKKIVIAKLYQKSIGLSGESIKPPWIYNNSLKPAIYVHKIYCKMFKTR